MGQGLGEYERAGLFVQACDLARGEEVLLFGAGGFGRRALNLLRRERADVRPLAFVDSVKTGSVDGLPVLRPDAPALHAVRVLLTTPSWHALAVGLLDAGVRRFSVLKVCGEADHPVKTYAGHGGRLVYVRNAKAASTSVIHALESLGPVAVRDGFRDQPLFGAVAEPGALTFSFVRDPLRRVASCHRMLFGGGGNALGRTLARLCGREALTLAEFVQVLALEPPWAMDSHWKPQSFYVPREVHFIGRVERFADDVQRLSELAGVKLPAPHLHRTGGGASAEEFVDSGLRAVLEEVYASDRGLYETT